MISTIGTVLFCTLKKPSLLYSLYHDVKCYFSEKNNSAIHVPYSNCESNSKIISCYWLLSCTVSLKSSLLSVEPSRKHCNPRCAVHVRYSTVLVLPVQCTSHRWQCTATVHTRTRTYEVKLYSFCYLSSGFL